MKIYIVKPGYSHEGSGDAVKAFLDKEKVCHFHKELEAWYARRPRVENYYIDNGTFIPDVDENYDVDYDNWAEEYSDLPHHADCWVIQEVELVE